MKPSISFWSMLLLGLSLAGAAHGVGRIGDDAPPLDVERWVKGSAVSLSEGKGTNVYVVEFWATWCPPCRVSIPALTELQKKYRDQKLVVVGISTEAEAEVKPFVQQMADTMSYPIAVDKAESTYARYMAPYGMSTIPTAFVVNKEGKIAWVGSPLRGLSNAVDQVLSGKLDLAESAKQFEVMKKETGFQMEMQRYMLVCSQGSREMAEESGKKLFESIKDAPMLASLLSYTILTDGRFRIRDLKLARQAAEVAVVASDRKDIAALQCLAMAKFELGEKDQAIEVIKEAITKAADPKERELLKQHLAYLEKINQSAK